MATHTATIRAWVTVEFDDDGISELADQAVEAFEVLDALNKYGLDYEVMEVVPK